ncbi:Mastermind-like protein 3 [Bos mutus]|uniref:Mastermind-like protein 3 n=1 Tax=Bos mutus TaxID=72004 RepID=L8ILF1_9CETA|nr:Mastermind-like protein 3 [Bos mutus]
MSTGFIDFYHSYVAVFLNRLLAIKVCSSRHQCRKHFPRISEPGLLVFDQDRSHHMQNSALQETVKRKLEGARSPLNGDQQNGACDGSFSPTSKRIRKDIPTGMEAINNLPNNMPLPSASPLHQLDLKPSLPLQNSGTHTPGLLEDLSKNGRLPELKLPVNGCSDLEDSFTILQSKDLKQEPLDDPTCIDTSETSLSNQNKLFSDINLNDQEWQELIDELANTVPEDDIQDLFNEDFEEKKEPEFSQPATETPLSQESTSVKSDPSHSPFAHVSLGSPQARPSSSGPPFSTVSAATNLPSVATTPVAPNPASSPANCAVQSPQTPNPSHTPGQAPSRPGNGYLLNPASVPVAAAGSGPGAMPGSDLSPAEQLKQMAAQQQQRAKLMQQKQQQQQHSNQTSSWSPLGPPSSPYGAAFTAEKPNSPMMYPQAFNNQNPIVPPMANNLQKTTMNNYLPQNHLNMINQQPNNMGTNSLNKQHNILTYGNTKPLTHFNADLSQRMTPPMANPNKTPLTPYIQQQPPQPQPPQQPPPQLQAPRAHLSEDQKRVLLIKQKGVMSQPMAYPALPSHGQVVCGPRLGRREGRSLSGSLQPSYEVLNMLSLSSLYYELWKFGFRIVKAFFKICGKRDYHDMESVQISGNTRLTEDLFGDILLRTRLLADMSVGPQFGVLCFDIVTSRTASKHLSQMFQGSEREWPATLRELSGPTFMHACPLFGPEDAHRSPVVRHCIPDLFTALMACGKHERATGRGWEDDQTASSGETVGLLTLELQAVYLQRCQTPRFMIHQHVAEDEVHIQIRREQDCLPSDTCSYDTPFILCEPFTTTEAAVYSVVAVIREHQEPRTAYCGHMQKESVNAAVTCSFIVLMGPRKKFDFLFLAPSNRYQTKHCFFSPLISVTCGGRR